jgi:Holliday junction DNA helicase RuvA
MIHHLRGTLTDCTPTHAVIECGGVGYLLHISVYTSEKLKKGDEALLLVQEIIREDAHELYGFLNEKERQSFVQLTSVSGVGANTARMVLSSMTPDDLMLVIMNKDVDAFKRIKGIGAKTAQRIIVDLHDKFPAFEDFEEKSSGTGNTVKTEALLALSSLGFDKTKALKTLDKILKSEGTAISVEELIKLALKQL